MKMLDEYCFVKIALMFDRVPSNKELKSQSLDFLYFSESKET